MSMNAKLLIIGALVLGGSLLFFQSQLFQPSRPKGSEPIASSDDRSSQPAAHSANDLPPHSASEQLRTDGSNPITTSNALSSVTSRAHSSALAPLSAHVIKSVRRFGTTLVLLNERPLNELSHDELSLRFYLARNCSNIAILRDSENGLMTAIRQRPERFSQARLQAIKTLTEACHGVPASMFGVEAMSQLLAEMFRREDRPAGRLATLPLNYALWANLNDLHKLAASGDALAFTYALAMLSKDSIISVKGEAIKAEDFIEAWHLAACELAGGCGPESRHVLERCALLNQCGASSLLEVIRVHEPERYPLMLKLYPKLVEAFTSANWSGFDWSRARIDAKVVSLGPVEHDHRGKSDRPMR